MTFHFNLAFIQYGLGLVGLSPPADLCRRSNCFQIEYHLLKGSQSSRTNVFRLGLDIVLVPVFLMPSRMTVDNVIFFCGSCIPPSSPAVCPEVTIRKNIVKGESQDVQENEAQLTALLLRQGLT